MLRNECTARETLADQTVCMKKDNVKATMSTETKYAKTHSQKLTVMYLQLGLLTSHKREELREVHAIGQSQYRIWWRHGGKSIYRCCQRM